MWRKCNRLFLWCVFAVSAVWTVPVRAHGDVHQTILALSRELEEKPGNALLLMERAQLYAQYQHYPEALADLEQAERADPTLDTPLALRGTIFRNTGKTAEARTALEAFLKKHPANARVKFDYCLTLVDLKDTAAALMELDALLALPPRPSPEAAALRLRLTEAQGVDGPEAALKWVKVFLERHPLPFLEEQALRLEMQLGRPTEAVKRLDAMIARAPRPEALLLRKAGVLAGAGDAAGGEAAARAAREAISRLPEARRGSAAVRALEQSADKYLTPARTP